MKHFFSIIFLAAIILCSCTKEKSQPVEIALLLPLSDKNTNPGWDLALNWAKENIESAGGVCGKSIEFKVFDTAKAPFNQTLDAIAKDKNIKAVIGPDTSDQAFSAAQFFVKNKIVSCPLLYLRFAPPNPSLLSQVNQF